MSGIGDSWTPVDLERILNGREAPPAPSQLLRSDGVALLYPGRLHSLHGEPEAGKSWFAAGTCAQEVQAGRKVVVIDLEDHPSTWVQRLEALGTTADDLLRFVRYVAPRSPLTDEGWEALSPALSRASLVVVDSTSEAMALHGLNLSDNSDVASWIRIVRRFRGSGAAVLLLDHVRKDREGRGRYAIGGQAKLAAVDVAFSIHVVERWSQARSGSSAVKLEKDRGGYLRAAAEANGGEVARMLVSPAPSGGGVELSLEPPRAAPSQTALDDYMVRVSRNLEPEPCRGKRVLRNAVGGDNGKVDAALKRLVAEGYVEVTRDGQAFVYSSVSPYPRPAQGARVPRAAPEGAAARSTHVLRERASGISTPEARQPIDPARQHGSDETLGKTSGGASTEREAAEEGDRT